VHRPPCPIRRQFTILDRQVEVRTDSTRIAEIVGDMFGSVHFRPTEDPPQRRFWCALEVETPWQMMIGDEHTTFAAHPSPISSKVFDLLRLDPDGPQPARYFSYDVYYDHPSRDTTLELFASHFQRMILRDLLADRPELSMIHAGTVGGDRRGALLVAGTGGGKSTLTLACTLRGLRFLSDDFALVDVASGELVPFPRAVRLRRAACELVPDFGSLCTGVTVDAGGHTRYYVHPERLRPDALGEAVPLTHAFRLQGFAARPSLSPARPADVAVTCAQSDCFAPERDALALVWRWGELMEPVVCADLVCGSPLDSAERVLDFLAGGAYD